MTYEIITGLLYIRFDDISGTTPLAWYPNKLGERKRMLLGIKSISLLTGEEGLIPDDLVYIPLPSIKSKALIKYLKWKNVEKRGGSATSAIILLYPEQFDAIYYKYREELENIFDKFSRRLKKLEKEFRPPQKFSELITQVYETLKSSINNWKKKEINQESQNKEKNYEQELIVHKTLLLGDAKVGKTSIVLRFTDHAFNQKYLPTIGVNITQKDIKVENTKIRSMLWDIAGQEKFSNLRRRFFLGSECIILVFDLTNPKSFQNLKKWYNEIADALGKKCNEIIGVIFGNKFDLSHKRKISEQQAKKFAKDINFDYIETSALTGYNIHQAFYDIGMKSKEKFA